MANRPSTGFTSIGRVEKHQDRERRTKRFFQKKFQEAEDSISILAFREKTLKSQGIANGYDEAITQYTQLKDSSANIARQMSDYWHDNQIKNSKSQRIQVQQ